MKYAIRSSIPFLFAFLFFSVGRAADGDEGARTKSFTVAKGGNLEVSTGVGDIQINPWDKNEVRVSVEGIDDEDLDRLKMTQSDNSIHVSYRPKWRYNGGGDVRFEIDVPSQFNVDLKTSGGSLEVSGTLTGKLTGTTAGGDIKLKNIVGPVEMSTSGGNIEAGDIKGDGYLKTSGGDIQLGTVSGEVDVSTSGGEIRVDKVGKALTARTSGGDIEVGDVGGEARVSTAGGDIKMGRVSGRVDMSTAGGGIDLKGATGTVSARTAGGDIRIKDVSGSIDAKTAGGEVDAELIPSGRGESQLESAGGMIRLAIPENAKATIEARIRIEDRWGRGSDRYKIRSDFKADSYEKDEDAGEIRAVYKLNGGGDTVSLETVNSDIEIKKLSGH